MSEKPSFVLPAKVGAYLKRLSLTIKSSNAALASVLNSCRYSVREGVNYDNWNGGTYGHEVVLFFPEQFFEKFSAKDQKQICDYILENLREVSASVDNEFLSNVVLELIDEDDAEYQASRNVAAGSEVAASTLPFWNHDYVRLFISHRDSHKKQAHLLADSLMRYGISSFVAHDTIQPMTTWQREIIKALQTMEVMLCFITDGFHESVWTNQEIGYALGRRIPIISLKLQSENPAGFTSSEQALRGSIDAPAESAEAVAELIAGKIGHGERVRKSLLGAFAAAPSFEDAKFTFDRLVKMVPQINQRELNGLVRAFNENLQLRNAFYLTRSNRLLNYLSRASGRSLLVNQDGKLVEEKRKIDDIPF